MERLGFRTLMTLVVGGGLLISAGVAIGALWMSPGLQAAFRPVAGAEQSPPSLILVSPMDPAAPSAAPPQVPARRTAAEEPRPNRPPAGSKPAAEGQSQARLAIVIDDLGYNLAMPERLLKLGLPLTLSILPGQVHSREVARLSREAGREFLVHIPMEPERFPEDDPGPNALLLSTGDEVTREQVGGQLDSLPGAVGANNHMGSAYTSHADKMGIVQEEIAERDMLFLNSKTGPATVPADIARTRGFRYLERDVFLDNERSESAIRRQLAAAVRVARSRGHAVAIGHPYPETLRVLSERLPHLAGEGVLLVPISQLIH